MARIDSSNLKGTPKARSQAFAIGDFVRVKFGTADPDFPDLPLGGWAGTIVSIDAEECCTIELNPATLAAMPSVYRMRCERAGFRDDILEMQPRDLEHDDPDGRNGPAVLEQPKQIVSSPLDLARVEDRIRAALRLTADEAIPKVSRATLYEYFEYLDAEMQFPFEAVYHHRDGEAQGAHHLMVTGMCHDRDHIINDEFGLNCLADEGPIAWEVPLVFLELPKSNANSQMIEDYRHWQLSWGRVSLPTVEEHECDQEYGFEVPSKVGRNDPCPCGSGEKYKKCCLKWVNYKPLFEPR